MAYLFTEILIISWHTEIWKGLCEKNQDNKIKDSGEAYDINWFTDVLTWFQSAKRAGLQHFYASEYSCIIIIFYAIIYICKPGAINGRKSNFILTFLLEGCLVYQIYQVQYLQSHKPGFRGYKIIK